MKGPEPGSPRLSNGRSRMFLAAADSFWRRLTEPADSVFDPGQRRQVRLLASLTLFLFCFVILVSPIVLGHLYPSTSLTGNPIFYISIFSGLGYAAGYLLSRTRHYPVGSAVTVTTTTLVTFSAVLASPEPPMVYLGAIFLHSAVLQGAMLLPVQLSAATAAVAAFGLLIVGLASPLLDLATVVVPWSGLVTNVGLMYLFQRHRNRLEEVRTSRLAAEVEERSRAEQLLGNRNLALLSLQEASVTIASSLELGTVLDTVTAEMVEQLGVDGCTLSEWDRRNETVVALPESSHDYWHSLEASQETYALAQYPLTRQVLETRQPVQIVASDPAADPAELAVMERLGIRTLLMLAMVSQGRVIGLVELSDGRERDFSPAQIGMAQLLANQAASAIRNARLYQRAQREIEERSQIAEALKESEARYRSLVEDMPAFVTRFRPGGIMTYANKHYCDYFQRSPDEVIGRSFFDLLPEDDRDLVERTYSSLTADNPAVTYEHQVLAPDGSIRWHRWTDRALFDDEGQVIEYQCLGRDVTEVKQAEEELRRHRDHLEEQVQLRTDQLNQAYQQLSELDEVKGRFIADVSHELRTPIMNLGLYLDLLEKGSADKREQYQDVLRRQSDRLKELLFRILDFSGRDTSGNGQSLEAVDLNQLVQLAAGAQQARAASHDLALKVSLEPELGLVRGEPSQLIRVIENLISNAISYTPAGEVRVATGRDEDAGRLFVSVEDTGIGMEGEDLKRCFERFYRGENRAGSPAPGAGLGLAVVKEIVDLHKGMVQVESSPGEGSTFTVLLPHHQRN